MNNLTGCILTVVCELYYFQDRSLAFYAGWWAEPIFKTGDYPDVMRYKVISIIHINTLKI